MYKHRLAAGVAREQARKDLLLSTYTEAYWKIDLHNLFHFLSLRMDAHAQHEIRQYPTMIGNEIVAKWCPIAWEAFVDYRLNGIFLSRLDQEVIQKCQTQNTEDVMILAKSLGWLDDDHKPKRSRERDEFESKANALGITIPWRKLDGN